MKAKFITMEDAGRCLIDAGFTGWRVPTFIAIGWAESAGNAWAVNLVVQADPLAASHLSMDLGWLQLNNYWWADDLKPDHRAAFDPAAAARIAFRHVGGNEGIFDAIAKKSTTRGYMEWSTYKVKVHLPYLSAAIGVARALGVGL